MSAALDVWHQEHTEEHVVWPPLWLLAQKLAIERSLLPFQLGNLVKILRLEL